MLWNYARSALQRQGDGFLEWEGSPDRPFGFVRAEAESLRPA